MHDDGRLPGVEVCGGRESAEVPAVAGGEQWQEADRRVLSPVQSTRNVGPQDAARLDRLLVDRPPCRGRVELAHRQRQRHHPEVKPVAQAPHVIANDAR